MFGFGKKQKKVIENKVVKELIQDFDELAYLEANPDVKEGIENGQFKDALHHLETFGLNEIEQGLRKFHKDFEEFNDLHYIEYFPELKKLIDSSQFQSSFDHFCQIGYSNLLQKNMKIINQSLETTVDDLIMIENFNVESYLECNLDVKEAVKNGDFLNVNFYLKHFGLKRIKEGKEKFHKDYDPFNEVLYLECFPDVKQSIKENTISSAFEHFIHHGYNEIINGIRQYSLKEVQLSNLVYAFNSKSEYYNFCNTFNIKSVDIILPVHNALDDVKKCIHSVFDVYSYPFHLILIDDHSDNDTKLFLEQEKNEKKIELFRNEKNLRFTKSVNRGLDKSKADIVILLNSDTIVTKNWIEKILTCFDSNKNIGIVGPLSNAASWQTIPVRDNPLGGWLVNEIPDGYSIDKMSELVEVISEKKYPKVPSVNGFCYAIKRELLNLNGNLDEEYFPTG